MKLRKVLSMNFVCVCLNKKHISIDREEKTVKAKIKRIIYDCIYLFLNYFIAYIPFWTLRKLLYQTCGLKIGKGSRINMRCILMNPWLIKIGQNTIVNEYTLIDGRGGVIVGNNCSISMFSVIYSASHRPETDNLEYYKKLTIIKDNVWIGARAVILAGSYINNNCIVGANSVVSAKECQENGIYAGTPAKLINIRKVNKIENQKIYMFFR